MALTSHSIFLQNVEKSKKRIFEILLQIRTAAAS